MWFGPTLQKPRGISGEMEMEVKAGIAREREQMGQPSGGRRKGREMRGGGSAGERQRDPWEIYMSRNENIIGLCVCMCALDVCVRDITENQV